MCSFCNLQLNCGNLNITSDCYFRQSSGSLLPSPALPTDVPDAAIARTERVAEINTNSASN